MKKCLYLIFIFIGFSFNTSSALTPEEIVFLKQNGVSDETIQIMIKTDLEEKKLKRTEPGVSQKQLSEEKSAIIYSTGAPSRSEISEEQQKNVDRAWDMLRNMFIKIE